MPPADWARPLPRRWPGRLVFKHLCVREMPRSGKPDELLDAFGISARHIAAAVRGLI